MRETERVDETFQGTTLLECGKLEIYHGGKVGDCGFLEG